jgi:hypothetical protein
MEDTNKFLKNLKKDKHYNKSKCHRSRRKESRCRCTECDPGPFMKGRDLGRERKCINEHYKKKKMRKQIARKRQRILRTKIQEKYLEPREDAPVSFFKYAVDEDNETGELLIYDKELSLVYNIDMDLVIDYTITGSSVVIRYYKGGHKTISLE